MKKLNRIFLLFISLIIFSLLLQCSFHKKKSKNVIILISDGCGYNHILAADYYQYGKTGKQVYEKFPVCYGVSTFSAGGEYDKEKVWKSFDYVNLKYTDSAASATAIATGVKTKDDVIAMDMQLNLLKTIVQIFEDNGRSTGVVTSVSLSHATPAGFVAHNEYRYNYVEIAKEMILQSRMDVILGCGHPFYNDEGVKLDSAEYNFKYVGGKSTWQSLVNGSAGNDADDDGDIEIWKLIQERNEFTDLESGTTPERVIGIPKVRKTLQQGRGGDAYAEPFEVELTDHIPSLKEMSKAALNILDDDPEGFFLMIEGGAVDGASHDNQSGRMIEEQIDFNRAVESVVSWVDSCSNWDETLVIITADHECGYLAGPNSGKKEKEGNKPVWNKIRNNGKGKVPGMEWYSGDHTNSLVPLFAKGGGSEFFHKYAVNQDSVRGKYIDNTDIFKVILESSGIILSDK